MLSAVHDSILSNLGSSYGLAVARFANFDEVSERSNLPTTLLAAQRVFVAAGVSRLDWVSCGSLSASRVGLVVKPGFAGRSWPLQEALDKVSVRDEESDGLSLPMLGDGVCVGLSEYRDLSGVLEAVDAAFERLQVRFED